MKRLVWRLSLVAVLLGGAYATGALAMTVIGWAAFTYSKRHRHAYRGA